jgi:hypothetical protein
VRALCDGPLAVTPSDGHTITAVHEAMTVADLVDMTRRSSDRQRR